MLLFILIVAIVSMREVACEGSEVSGLRDGSISIRRVTNHHYSLFVGGEGAI